MPSDTAPMRSRWSSRRARCPRACPRRPGRWRPSRSPASRGRPGGSRSGPRSARRSRRRGTSGSPGRRPAADVLRLARDRRGWGSVGRPEFGRFKYVHTNPDVSTSGLEAVSAEYSAAAGKREGLTLADLGRVTTTIRAIERAIVHYGDTTLYIADQLRRNGPGYASAVAMEETTLVDFNRHRGRQPRLVALYPREGTFVSDSPYIIPRAPWVTARLAMTSGERTIEGCRLRRGRCRPRGRADGPRARRRGTTPSASSGRRRAPSPRRPRRPSGSPRRRRGARPCTSSPGARAARASRARRRPRRAWRPGSPGGS